MAIPIAAPRAAEATRAIVSVIGNCSIPTRVNSSCHRSNIKGTNRVRTIEDTIGTAIVQPTSGARRVLGCVEPPNTSPNTRAKFSAVKPFTSKTTAIDQLGMAGSLSHRSMAQKDPKGNRATIPMEPATKAIVETGIFDHKPPIWVISWVLVFRMTPPMLVNRAAFAIAWVSSNSNATSVCCNPTAMNTNPR